jgi:hypothetical protein
MLPEPHMSPGVVAPIDSQGIVDPGDMDPDGARNGIDVGEYEEVANTEAGGDPDGTQGIVIGGAPADDVAGAGGSGGGDGSEVSIKEVDPAPQPGAGAHGTGGGGGSEVSFKEVEPGVPSDGDAQGIIIDTSVDNPDYQPAAAGDGSVRDPASLVGFNPQPDPPGVATPADGIIVQSG